MLSTGERDLMFGGFNLDLELPPVKIIHGSCDSRPALPGGAVFVLCLRHGVIIQLALDSGYVNADGDDGGAGEHIDR